jgi:hypothetical protein
MKLSMVARTSCGQNVARIDISSHGEANLAHFGWQCYTMDMV